MKLRRPGRRLSRRLDNLMVKTCRSGLHDLVLSKVRSFSLHRVATAARSLVFNEGKAKRAATVLISGKFLNGGLCGLRSVEANHTGTTGPAIRLILNLGLVDLPNGGEQLD